MELENLSLLNILEGFFMENKIERELAEMIKILIQKAIENEILANESGFRNKLIELIRGRN